MTVWNYLAKRSPRLSEQFFRNGVVAAISFVVDYAAYFICYKITHSIVAALIFGYCSGIIINFILSTIWVFNEQRFAHNLFKQFALFCIGALSGLLVEMAVLLPLERTIDFRFARIASIVVAFFWNFAVKKKLIYRRRRKVPLHAVLALYEHLTFPEKCYLAVRFTSCPIDELPHYLPQKGRVLEIGCGSGINLAVIHLLRPELELHGCDIDPKKVALAQKLSIPAKITGMQTLKRSNSWDAILIVDVLYLMPHQKVQELLKQSLAKLSAHGTLVIKEMSEKPVWKNSWNKFQEHISLRVTKMTASEESEQDFVSTEDIRKSLVQMGLEPAQRRIDKNYIHPHAVVHVEK